MDDRKYWVWMSMCLGQGSMRAGKILDCFGTPEKAADAGYEELAKCIGENVKKTRELFSKHTIEQAADIVSWCDLHNVRILTVHDDDYPGSIRRQTDLPLVLYTYGKMPELNDRFSCAVVGTRKMTDYGKRTSFDLGYELSEGGAIVVSGLAYGVDSMAMAGALRAGGQTVGVLGCGIDICYPKVHRDLMKHVVKSGAVITEYPPATPPLGAHFPKRNRIISGISQATVVVEGDDNSGALITANHAVYQGKSVFAVPGNVDSDGSLGPNYLIKHGIPAITEASDVLLEFKDIFPDVNPNLLRRKYISDDPNEYLEAAAYYHVVSLLDEPVVRRTKRKSDKETKSEVAPPVEKEAHPDAAFLSTRDKKYIDIYNSMKPDVPMLPDEITSHGYDISEVMAAMTVLELAGAVDGSPGGYFTRKGNEDLSSYPNEMEK